MADDFVLAVVAIEDIQVFGCENPAHVITLAADFLEVPIWGLFVPDFCEFIGCRVYDDFDVSDISESFKKFFGEHLLELGKGNHRVI